jgi:hypothetical protein
MELAEYKWQLAEQLVHELQPVLAIKEFTDNAVLLGAYAEATVRRLTRRVVYPMRVSTGAVLDFPMPDPLRQLDLIVWAPFPAPAIFEVEDFALIPRSSAFGSIEIKRSNYTGIEESLEKFVDAVGNPPRLVDPDATIGDSKLASLGVVPVLENAPSKRLALLLESKKAVAIFEQGQGKPKVRQKDVFELINFLNYIRCRYYSRSARSSYPILQTEGL